MAIKGELLKLYTENQLRNCGKVGMYRFGEVLHLTPEQAHTIVEENEILYLNKHQMHQYGVNRMVFKRNEIRSDKDSLPYCGRFEFFEGEEFITIQEIYTDDIKCKIIGPKESIDKIKANKMLHSGMSDADFEKANEDVLNEIKYIEGYYNKPRDEVDVQGLHISKIEDYDNYEYSIYNSERTVYKIYNIERQKELEQKKMEGTVKFLKNKIKKYEKSLKDYPLSKIKRTFRNKREFVEEIQLYDWTDTEALYRDMKSIAIRHKVGLTRAWKVWKFVMLPKMQEEIESLEDKLGKYSINNIHINMCMNRINLGNNLTYNWVTGVIK